MRVSDVIVLNRNNIGPTSLFQWKVSCTPN